MSTTSAPAGLSPHGWNPEFTTSTNRSSSSCNNSSNDNGKNNSTSGTHNPPPPPSATPSENRKRRWTGAERRERAARQQQQQSQQFRRNHDQEIQVHPTGSNTDFGMSSSPLYNINSSAGPGLEDHHYNYQQQQQQQQPHPHPPPPPRYYQQQDLTMTTTPMPQRRQLTFSDRLMACAERIHHTNSVVVFPATTTRIRQGDEYERYQAPVVEPSIRIVTNCELPNNYYYHGQEAAAADHDGYNRNYQYNNQYFHAHHHMEPSTTIASSSSATTIIHVKPLLVLDLNGILCHRIRRNREPPPPLRNRQYRPYADVIVKTPVIPRTDVGEFCTFLAQHFTLAVWTSAQRKTALQLVNLLVPPHVQQRLLFVWSQGQCDRVVPPQQQHDPSQVLYLKDLSKVWREFPLWNAGNTLIMDDSPEKCPHFRNNALHPPPIHGKEREPQSFDGRQKVGEGEYHDYEEDKSHSYYFMSDEENQTRQTDFFYQLSQFWRMHPMSQVIWKNDSYAEDPTRPYHALLRFLQDYGVGHMGWMVVPSHGDDNNSYYAPRYDT